LWLYTPAAQAAADALPHDVLVYDCMDQLANFRFADPRLPAQEAKLLRRADLVFTGGPSLWQDKRQRRPDAHLFPSGVDQAHFGKARLPATRVPYDVIALPGPVLGFFGVIDERIDLGLLAAVAEARPRWSLALIGPVVKIDPADLPQAPNLHYLGPRDYAELPGYLRGFDVCLLPFARNEATRFISPTKTLEYLAGHKAVISTPIRDVVTLYGEVVRVADTPEAFVREVEAALRESGPQKKARYSLERRLLEAHAWDAIAAEMAALIEAALARRGVPLEAAV
jgi:UDP-galactopyranose mutase